MNLKEFDIAMESNLRSDLQADYKPKGHLSLSNFKEKKITKITPEMKKSSLTFFKSIDTKKDVVYIWLNDNDEIVGVVSVRPGLKTGDREWNWITGIQLNPRYKGYGLGKQLLDFSVSRLKGNALTVETDNKVAFEMYKKRGFSVSKESLADVEAGRRHVYFMYLK